MNKFKIAQLTIASFAIGAILSLVFLKQQPNTIIIENNQATPIRLSNTLSDRQQTLLAYAFVTAKKDGLPEPELLQGILFQESKAGGMPKYKVSGHNVGLKVNSRYYGVGQIKLAAAKDVLNRWPNLYKEFVFHTNTDEEIISKLIYDDKFNIAIASKYLVIMKSYGYKTLRELALAYNQGPTGAKSLNANDHPYSNGVVNNIQKINI